MKKGLSVFFLVLYLTTVFSSLLPYIEYAVNYKYISEVLCVNKDEPESSCHGKCHLNKKVAETVEAKIPIEDNDSVPAVLTARDFSPAIINRYSIFISSPFILLGKYYFKEFLYQKEICRTIFHPPQFV